MEKLNYDLLVGNSKDAIITQSPKQEYKFQIDVWKSLMILLVIMDHTFTHSYLATYASVFWERISIPLLMIVMGYNLGISLDKKKKTALRDLYSKSYVLKKMKRYVLPYLILYAIHLILFLIEQNTSMETFDTFYYENNLNVYIGYTPFYGPGMWFIPTLFTTILIFPLLYWCYKKKPGLTLIGTYLIEILWSLLKYNIYNNVPSFEDRVTSIYFQCHIFSFFSAIGLGLWFSSDDKITSLRNWFIWILLIVSLISMKNYTLTQVQTFQWISGDYHFMFFPYSGFLFLLGMRYFPKNPHKIVKKVIRTISKSTYHILLSQILYFSIVYQFFLKMFDPSDQQPDIFDGNPTNYYWYFPMSIIISVCIGVLWNELEERFYKKAKFNKKWMAVDNFDTALVIITYIGRIISALYFLLIFFLSIN